MSHKDTKPTSILADDFGHESIKNEAFSFKKNNHEKRHILGIFPRQSTGQILSKWKIQTPAELSVTKPKLKKKNNQRKQIDY